MNKSYKIVFNKARGKMVAVNEIAKAQGKGKTITATCAIALLSLASLNAAAVTSVTTAGGYRITAAKTDNIYSAEEANSKYQAFFASGMNVTSNAFYVSGQARSPKNSKASLTLDVKNILVNSSKVGLSANYGELILA